MSEPDGRLGRFIRALRTSRGLTLTDVAAVSGLSHPFLSQVERGIHEPSLSSLRAIARALSSSPLELLAAAEDPANRSPFVLTPAGSGTVPESFNSGDARLLAHLGGSFHVIELDAASGAPGDEYVHDESEFVYLVEGELSIELDDERLIMHPGDSIHFRGGVRHRWWSESGPFRVIVVKAHPALVE